MRKYLGEVALPALIQRIKDVVEPKADRAELAIQTNQNLLDNWYFINPINQRGATEYQSVDQNSFRYTLDRWFCGYRSSITVQDNGVLISSIGNSYHGMAQILTKELIEQYKGKNVTLSALYTGHDIMVTELNGAGVTGAEAGSPSVVQYTFPLKADPNNRMERHPFISTYTNCTVYAVKLEAGDKQTLARQENGAWVLNDPPPDRTQELLKCQRYFQIFSQNNLPDNPNDYRPTLRAKPTTGSLSIGEQTYYYASAEL